MIIRISLFVIFLSFLGLLQLSSQTQVGLPVVEINEDSPINSKEIESKAFELLNADSDAQKLKLNQELKQLLSHELRKEEAMHQSFSEVSSISILSPNDTAFRLFNWIIPWADGTYSYECGLLQWSDDSSNFYFFSLPEEGIDEQSMLENQQWIPGLFYEIIKTKSPLQEYYTLLTWDGNNLLSNKKRIDVLWFDRAGNPRFGAPIFQSGTEKRMRMCYEFGGQNSMRLSFNQKLERIELDHLSPPSKNLEGIYEYYGADLSYDGFVWKKNRWVLEKDINIEEGLRKNKKTFEVEPDEIKKRPAIYSPSN